MDNIVSFEENYIFRNNRSITSNNDIALTEFVANACECFLLGKHTVERVCSGLSPLRRDRLWC